MKKNQYSDLILDQTKDLVWAVDSNLFLVYANKAYLNLMKEVTGMEKGLNTPILVEGFGEGYIEKWKTYYQRALSKEYFEIVEHFYNPETEEMQYGHIAFSPIQDELGEIITVACRSTDITPVIRQNNYESRLLDASFWETGKAAQELEKAYKEKNKILESIGDAFFALDKHWNVTYWNKRAEEIIGIPREDVIGNNLWKVYPDVIDTGFYRQYHRAMDTGETVNFEEYFPTLDMWFEVTVYPSKDGLSVYFKDITQRKKANEEIAKSEEKRRLIMNGALDAIITIDTNDTTTFWNPQAEVIFGWKAEEVMGKPLSETIIPEPFRKYHVEGIKNYLKTGEGKAINVLLELSAIRRNGEEFPIELTVLPIKQGNEEFFCAFIRDITQRKKAERELLAINEKLSIQTKELERSNLELEQFAFITSHDLQEPLRMIYSFMDLLKKKYSDQLDDKALQYIHFATDGAIRMKQIILDLLLYSRANKPIEQLEEVNLNEIITEYTQLRRKLIVEKNASITFDALPVLETYRVPITQIIHCLLDNALRYVKENVTPRIEIQAKDKEKMWEFSVKDNGIGIDQMFYDKIFIIFQRLHNREQHDGNGIGLTIAKRSVEFLGGEIWLESTVGKGSTFYFTIAKIIT